MLYEEDGPRESQAVVTSRRNRISLVGVILGTLVALASLLVLDALGSLLIVSLSGTTTVAGLSRIGIWIGVWLAISVFVALFLGSMFASRVGAVRYSNEGLLHGVAVWALFFVAIFLFLFLSALAVVVAAGSLAAAFQDVISVRVTIRPVSFSTALSMTRVAVGVFLLISLLGLGGSLFGGWLGSGRIDRTEESLLAEERRHRAA